MTGSHISHVTVTYTSYGVGLTCVYAVNEDVVRELKRQVNKPTGNDLNAWLNKRGCKLDSSDGPALVRQNENGSTEESYFRDGKLHREDGPAVLTVSNGSMLEMYYRDGVGRLKDEYYAEMNPLLMGLNLWPVTGGSATIDALVREAMADQSTPVRSSTRKYVPLPLCP